MEDSVTQDLEQLSLNALAGTAVGDVLQLRDRVQNKVMLILVDSGSTNSFVSKSFLASTGLTPIPTTPKQVKLPNGQLLVSDLKVPAMEWWCQGHTLMHDMQVLNLAACDAILGYDWLKLHSPMTCLWDQHTIEFEEKGILLKLQGVHPAPMSLTLVSMTKVVKLHKSNDIWALTLIQSVPPPLADPPEAVQSLLQEFEDVFSKPTTLPPSRPYDHTIPLLPDAVPVNTKPYRYSPIHKDEIERQVKELLSQGFITQSTSPFAPLSYWSKRKMGHGDSVLTIGSLTL